MQSFPHSYTASASGEQEGFVTVQAADRPDIRTAPPPEFGGPDGEWSPEHLLVASVADCFILSFRAVARASRLEWESLECEVNGDLDRVDRVTRFTRLTMRPELVLPSDADAVKASRCLEKAKQACLITNSLNAEVILEPRVLGANASAGAAG